MSKFNNPIFEGQKGQLLLQLTKSYHGDDRFKLTKEFKDDVDEDKLKRLSIEAPPDRQKPIKKTKQPLIIRRFQPGTQQAKIITSQAVNIQNKRLNEQKQLTKQRQKMQIKKGIDRIKQAQAILTAKKPQEKPRWKMQIKGDRAQAFKAQEFKLFE